MYVFNKEDKMKKEVTQKQLDDLIQGIIESFKGRHNALTSDNDINNLSLEDVKKCLCDKQRFSWTVYATGFQGEESVELYWDPIKKILTLCSYYEGDGVENVFVLKED